MNSKGRQFDRVEVSRGGVFQPWIARNQESHSCPLERRTWMKPRSCQAFEAGSTEVLEPFFPDEFAVLIDQSLHVRQLSDVEPCRLPQGNLTFNDKDSFAAAYSRDRPRGHASLAGGVAERAILGCQGEIPSHGTCQ